MKKIMICLCLGIVPLCTKAQKSPVKFGDIPLKDLQMTIYDKDSSAAAVVLMDYGETNLVININTAALVIERHTRIKILKKEGLDWANVAIRLWHIGTTQENISNLKASTYNLENGKMVETKMSKGSVFKEKFNKSIDLQKFALPNVKEGSVIEYSYRINSEFITNFPDWQFQYKIPVIHSEYWAMIPEFFTFEKYMQGYVLTSYEVVNKSGTDFQSNAHHWVCQHVPAFKEEPYMTSEEDYVSKINFALSYVHFPGRPVEEVMGSWQKLNDNLLESEAFGTAIKGSNFLKKQVEELIAGLAEPQQKITAIFNYVRQNFEWDGTKDMLADPLKRVFELKKGTTGDLNILLASMLEKAGFNVDMVLLSTRDHGFIRQQYPMQSQFNYVVCAVKLNDKAMLLDATEKLLPMGTLPERCLNGEGLIISKTNHGWMKIEPKAKSKTVVNADLVLHTEGDLTGKINFVHDGYNAQKMRKHYIDEGEDEYIKDFLEGKTWEIENKEFQNIKEIDQSVKEKYELRIEEYVSVAGDAMYVNPFVVNQLSENPFKLDKRQYPVDYGSPIEKIYLCKIAIPEGYTVETLPQNRVMVLPGNAAKYVFSISVIGNLLSVLSNFQINKSLFVQDEYPNLREFYNQVVAKQVEQIVLKKKS